METVPVVWLDVDDTRAMKIMLVANKSNDLASYDDDLLNEMIAELNESSDLTGTGYSLDDLLNASGYGKSETEDAASDALSIADELQMKWKTEPGQIWQAGRHRIMCGDCANSDDMSCLMRGNKADLLLSDPPYGVSYVGKTKESLVIENDDLDEMELAESVHRWFSSGVDSCRAGAYFVVTVPSRPLQAIFVNDLKSRGILRQILVWVKDSLVLGHSEYHYRHEPILFGWLPGGNRLKNKDRTRTSVWEFDRPKASPEHPTMKPVPMFAYAISNHTKVAGIVLDIFLGSGTTLIAAEETGRTCYGMEIDPKYVAVCLERISKLGIEPKLVSDG